MNNIVTTLTDWSERDRAAIFGELFVKPAMPHLVKIINQVNGQTTHYGFFDDMNILLASVAPYHSSHEIRVSLNPFDCATIECQTNKLHTRTDEIEVNENPVYCNNLLLVPEVPNAKTSQDFREAAMGAAKRLENFKWPEPVVIDLGGKYGLIYRIGNSSVLAQEPLMRLLHRQIKLIHGVQSSITHPSFMVPLPGTRVGDPAYNPFGEAKLSKIEKFPATIENCSDAVLGMVMPPDCLPAWEEERRKLQQNESTRGVTERQPASSKRKEAAPEEKDACAQVMKMTTDMEFFHDETKVAYARIPRDGYNEILPVKDERFRQSIMYAFYLKHQRVLASEITKKVTETLAGKAIFAGKMYPLSLRVASSEGAYWYDLSNARCQSVKITQEGWNVEDRTPILFRSNAKNIAQVIPKPKGDIKLLFKYVNIQDPLQQCLFLVYLVYCLIPDLPKPLAHPFGEKGSGKTTFSRIVKSLVDPSCIEVMSMPGSKDEMVLQAYQSYMPAYDNEVSIKGWQSDILCCAATGGGMVRRKPYSGTEEIVLHFTRPIIVNGINTVAENPDVLDRCLFFEQARIPAQNRIPEEKFWENFKEDKTSILGGMFDTLSAAMGRFAQITLESYPRMADFVEKGCAIAEAMGYDRQQFLDAYDHNIKRSHAIAIDNHPVALTIMKQVAEQPERFEATAANMLVALARIAEAEGIISNGRQFPKTPSVLIRQLREIKSNLQAQGIDFEVKRDSKNNSIVSIFPNESPVVNA